MTAGRPPLPGNVHLLRGDPSKLGETALEGEIRPKVMLCDPPWYLSDVARAEWWRIGRELETLGLVSALDLAALAAYCASYADWVWARDMVEVYQAGGSSGEDGYVAATPQGYKQISVYVQLVAQHEKRMREWVSHFGLSPAARARVRGQAQGSLFPESDPMAAFVRAGRNA